MTKQIATVTSLPRNDKFCYEPCTAKRSNLIKRCAFTLAEVLITLGIIGVVAAITLPILVQNYQKKVAATKVKKAYTEMLQAIRLSEVENNPISEWSFPSANSATNTRNFVDTFIVPYFKDLKYCSSGKSDTKCGLVVSSYGANYILPNGTGVSILTSANSDLYVLFDINSPQKPNLMGTDAFYFITYKGKLMPYGWYDGIKREDVFTGWRYKEKISNRNATLKCNNTRTNSSDTELNRHGCTALLMLDGWEMKSDYPY